MADFGRLNSATKYPSIETYHVLDPANGRLLDQDPAHFWQGAVSLTEKVDGVNGRVIVMADGDWFIGSREEILYARGDRIENPELGIVPGLLRLAPTLLPSTEGVTVYYLEVYGKGTSAAKNYTGAGGAGYRLFDCAYVPPDVLDMTREQIASWREHGGQQFSTEEGLLGLASWHKLPVVPRLGTVDAADLPTGLAEMQKFLQNWLPVTTVALDDKASGRPEGIVLRTRDRGLIAKAKFKDYERALQPPQKRRSNG